MLPLFGFVLLPLVMLAYSVRQSSSYVKRITRQKQLQHVFIQHRNEGHDDDKMKLAWLVASLESSATKTWTCHIQQYHTSTPTVWCIQSQTDVSIDTMTVSLYIYILYITLLYYNMGCCTHTRTHTHTLTHTHILSLSLWFWHTTPKHANAKTHNAIYELLKVCSATSRVVRL